MSNSLNLGLNLKLTNTSKKTNSLNNIYYLIAGSDSIIDENNNNIELVI